MGTGIDISLKLTSMDSRIPRGRVAYKIAARMYLFGWRGISGIVLALPSSQFRHFSLHAAQVGVDAILFNQFVVGADLGEFALVEDEQAMGVFEGR